MSENDEGLVAAFLAILKELRNDQNLTHESLAELAGIDRTYIGVLEKGNSQPTLGMAQKLAEALGFPLSGLVAMAEGRAGLEAAPPKAPERTERAVSTEFCHNVAQLTHLTGLTCEMLVEAIRYCYETLDIIDDQLIAHGSNRLAGLVELANLSSMVGNLLGAGIAQASNGLYIRNGPHTYPDLLPQKSPAVDLELKVALETNRPKGHLPKAGTYITFRYVLTDEAGVFTRGTANRGLRAFVWEAKVGVLTKDDFDISSTSGDSGKTAVIKTKVHDNMSTVYQVDDLNPYARPRIVEERQLALPEMPTE
ncbi:MAG TPA: helix-turn-helix transcriptional regulator [Candidatus Baltobacteraceae bacterium]